jgi:hypothetical protein
MRSKNLAGGHLLTARSTEHSQYVYNLSRRRGAIPNAVAGSLRQIRSTAAGERRCKIGAAGVLAQVQPAIAATTVTMTRTVPNPSSG